MVFINMPKLSLDAAGLVALADLTIVAQRAALTGTSALLDIFILCPGMHQQQSALALHGAEHPAVAAMTTGYVFRVENPATVHFLQKVGRTGHLTCLSVAKVSDVNPARWSHFLSAIYTFHNASFTSSVVYLSAACGTLLILILVVLLGDWWCLFVVLALMFARLCNMLVIRRRNELGWKGAHEPGVQGDLLVLLSQDRWIRMRGLVDDLKAVTSGQWLRDPTFVESSVSALATVLVYLDAALASNVTQSGKLLLLVLLIVSAGLLAIANAKTDILHMHGHNVAVVSRKKYDRRLDMAEQLIQETGRKDWAIRMGMIAADSYDGSKSGLDRPVTM